MKVQALIQAAGAGIRLGLGPKAFVMLDGRSLLERAIALFAGIVDDIIIAVPEPDMSRARTLVGEGIAIIAGAETRSETTRRLVAAATAPWLLLHDVVHPFATPDLARRLLAAIGEHGAAAPGIANTEFMYGKDGGKLHAPGEVLVGQKPIVFARADILAGYKAAEAAAMASARKDPSLLEVLERVGVRTTFVAGDPRNIKITGPTDLELAEAMMAQDRARRTDPRPPSTA